MVAEIAPETTPAVQPMMILVEIDAAILSVTRDHVDREKRIISSTKARQCQKRRIGDQQHAPFAMTQKNCAGSISQPP